MQGKLQDQIAFYLTGRRDGTGLEPFDAACRPALFARYADLASLRYDFPIVLNREGGPDRAVLSLSRMIDEAVAAMDAGPERDRIARHGYRIEREIRRATAGKGPADLQELWKSAAARLAEIGDEEVADSGEHLWRAFRANGEVVDAGAEMPVSVVRHAWQAAQAVKAAAFRERAERLLFKLRSILEAEAIGSPAGRSPDRLMAAVGSSFARSFDFDTMSRLLTEAKPNFGLSERRRERVEWLMDVIERQRFFPMTGKTDAYSFGFDRCSDALDAYRARRNEATTLLKALAIAELETKGEYRETVHDRLFEEYGANGLDAAELSQLPDYLITIVVEDAGPAEIAELTSMLAAGLPVKVLFRTDDILEPAPMAEGHIKMGLGARQMVQTAIGLTDVFVVQAAASHLFQKREAIAAALKYEGPAIFSIFSGAGGQTPGIPAYLVAAAAMESRAFPALVYNPSAGHDWATRFDVIDNPQPEQDWPVHGLAYEDGSLQARHDDVAFTFAEFAALDARCAGHFALVSGTDADGAMAGVPEMLQQDPGDMPDRVPGITLIDGDAKLRRAIVDRRIMLEAKRCLAMWHCLQELGGIHNSHAERQVARERSAMAELAVRASAAADVAASPQTAADSAEPAAVQPTPVAEIATEEGHGDDPYIETARCTSCNECTNVNNRMFAYNAEKQAYLANADAGTFRQLVEAAEGCQVSIIHPGKPRNPKEPGLEDLIKRAAPFN